MVKLPSSLTLISRHASWSAVWPCSAARNTAARRSTTPTPTPTPVLLPVSTPPPPLLPPLLLLAPLSVSAAMALAQGHASNISSRRQISARRAATSPSPPLARSTRPPGPPPTAPVHGLPRPWGLQRMSSTPSRAPPPRDGCRGEGGGGGDRERACVGGGLFVRLGQGLGEGVEGVGGGELEGVRE